MASPPAGLPEGIDPRLAVPCVHDPDSSDYLAPALWNTSPGRLPAWCQSRQVSFRMSLSELPPDVSSEVRYWAAGFVAGSTPTPPDAEEMSREALDEWATVIEHYLQSGSWPAGH